MMTLPPLDNSVLPAGIRSRFVDDINGLRIHILEAGVPGRGPAARPDAAWLPRACILMAQGDADPRRVRVSRRRARPAWLWPHHRLERQLRRRSQAVPPAERGARCGGAGCGLGLPFGRRGDGARLRRLGRGVVRAGAARCVPLARVDERALRRRAGAPVRRRWAPAGGARRPDDPRGARGAAAAAQALPVVVFDPARERQASTISCARIFTTRAPIGRRTSRIAWRRGARRSWRRCRPTTSWTWPTTCPRG